MLKRKLKENILRLYGKLQRSYESYNSLKFKNIPGLIIAESVDIIGEPIIDISHGARVEIGQNVTLNSKNSGYHINMHSPVKLVADREGAIIKIGDNTRIHGSCIHAFGSITIGRKCLIAGNCQIMDASGHSLSFDDVENRINTKGTTKSVVIGNCVWIGCNTIILPGVTIGKGSVIAAGSVVTNNIPEMVLAAGSPAKIIRDASKNNSLCE